MFLREIITPASSKYLGKQGQREKMDFSEIYINMCDKAQEIQFAHTAYEAGDFYCEGRDFITNKPYFSVTPLGDDGKDRTISNMKTWLPRQDQLLPIIGNYAEQCSFLSRNLMTECLYPDPSVRTMEQLLLTIIMRDKYNKVWNGTDWVKLNR
jgi:hypothetical protein